MSVIVVAIGAHFLLDFDNQEALLLGAVVSSTDAAAVFSVLRNMSLPRPLVSILEAESGFNDAPVVILVTLVSFGCVDNESIWYSLGQIVFELFVGAVVGLAIGWAGRARCCRASRCRPPVCIH